MRFRAATDKEIADRCRLLAHRFRRLDARSRAGEAVSLCGDLARLVEKGVEVRDLFDSPCTPEGVRLEGLDPTGRWVPLAWRILTEAEAKRSGLRATAGKIGVLEAGGWPVARNARVRVVWTAESARPEAHELAGRIAGWLYMNVKVQSAAEALGGA